MRKTDVSVFNDRAWLIQEVNRATVILRMLAGPDGEPRRQVVPLSFLQGRPIYRQISALDDVDIDLAKEEVRTEVDYSDFGDDPRKWTEAFCKMFASRPTPDMTIMLGWISCAIESGRLEGERTAHLGIAEKRRKSEAARRKAAKAGTRAALKSGKTAPKSPSPKMMNVVEAAEPGARGRALVNTPRVRIPKEH